MCYDIYFLHNLPEFFPITLIKRGPEVHVHGLKGMDQSKNKSNNNVDDDK